MVSNRCRELLGICPYPMVRRSESTFQPLGFPFVSVSAILNGAALKKKNLKCIFSDDPETQCRCGFGQKKNPDRFLNRTRRALACALFLRAERSHISATPLAQVEGVLLRHIFRCKACRACPDWTTEPPPWF